MRYANLRFIYNFIHHKVGKKHLLTYLAEGLGNGDPPHGHVAIGKDFNTAVLLHMRPLGVGVHSPGGSTLLREMKSWLPS